MGDAPVDGPHADVSWAWIRRWSGGKGVRVPCSAPARRILGLSAPTQPPPGGLETVAGKLLARAAPFDQPTQALLRNQWSYRTRVVRP